MTAITLSDNALAAISNRRTATWVANAYGHSRSAVIEAAKAAGWNHNPDSDAFMRAPVERPGPVVRPSTRDLLAEAADLAAGSRPIARALAKAEESLKALAEAVMAEGEKARLREKEAKLKAELEQVRTKLRGGATSRQPADTGDDVDPKAVRAWAAEQGIECPRVGRLPKAVLEQYRAAA